MSSADALSAWIPVTPSMTCSANAVPRGTIAGTPLACASSATWPSVSVSDGRQKMSADANTAARRGPDIGPSSLWYECSSFASSAGRAGPSPTMARRTLCPSRATMLTASIRRSMPFSSDRRATTNTNTASASRVRARRANQERRLGSNRRVSTPRPKMRTFSGSMPSIAKPSATNAVGVNTRSDCL